MPVVQAGDGAATAFSARRKRILTAAAAVFDSHGYQAATVRQIAAACGLTDAALYYYFHSKREILEAMIEEYHHAPLPPRTADGQAQLTREALDAAVDLFLDAAAENVEAMLVTARQSLLAPELGQVRTMRRGAWRDFFASRFDSRFSEDDTQLLSDCILTLLTGVVFTLRVQHGPDLPARLSDPAVRAHVHELLTVAAPFERFLPAAAAR